MPAQPDAPLHSWIAPCALRPAARLGGQPLATLASAVLHDTHSAPGAHPAQEAVHATAIAFLGLEGSLDGGTLEESRAGENRGSVPEPGHSDLDSAHVTSSAALMPCDVHRALLHSPPGSSRVWGSGIDTVQIAPSRPTYRYTRRQNKGITLLPGFGIDRMLDFGWLGSASLWKSGPLFSTGTKEAELMVRELRVEPAVAGGAICGLPA
jgi:hypothetical protein